MRAIWSSFTADNAGGFDHNKWLNPFVYGVQCLRTLGLPAAVLAVMWMVQRVRKPTGRQAAVTAMFLPVLLHGLSIQFLNLSFPRHVLPLLPLLLLVGASELFRWHRSATAIGMAVICWSVTLTLTDRRAVQRDARGLVMEWLAANVRQDVSVWADPYFKLPVEGYYPAAPTSRASLLLLHEGWTFRFERSELNPVRPPDAERLYHAHREELVWYGTLVRALEQGDADVVYAAGPSSMLPEQLLYRRLWGSLNKFAGQCRVVRVRARPEMTEELTGHKGKLTLAGR